MIFSQNLVASLAWSSIQWHREKLILFFFLFLNFIIKLEFKLNNIHLLLCCIKEMHRKFNIRVEHLEYRLDSLYKCHIYMPLINWNILLSFISAIYKCEFFFTTYYVNYFCFTSWRRYWSMAFLVIISCEYNIWCFCKILNNYTIIPNYLTQYFLHQIYVHNAYFLSG